MVDDLGRHAHVDALLKAVGPVAGLAIADIGCGEGALGRELAAQGAFVTGFDPFMAPASRLAVGTGAWQLVQAAAQTLPATDATFDLVLFVFSLHHVPREQLAAALAEVRRVLRPGGRLYVAEPVAEGPHQYIVELFHDETEVRAAAAAALARHAAPHFANQRVLSYVDVRHYASFDAFAARMIANMRFNGYSEEAVLAPAVRRRFAETVTRYGDFFDQPVRIHLYH
jgi:ubiquinone/menaquinone biosynthesis C-methylase UbiE